MTFYRVTTFHLVYFVWLYLFFADRKQYINCVILFVIGESGLKVIKHADEGEVEKCTKQSYAMAEEAVDRSELYFISFTELLKIDFNLIVLYIIPTLYN